MISDTQSISFGIVQTDSEMTPEGYRLFKVNGKPVLVRGGGWAPDMMLRVDESRREAEFRYVKEMGLNTIRLEGKLEDESFIERADRDGILVMAGWCCCDAWEKWGKWNEENKRISVSSLRDQLLRLRKHPSLLVWLNGSDNPPPADREQAYLDVEKEIHWPKPVISSATAKKAEVSGDSGVKMSGPYDYVPPDYWLLDTKAGGAYGFNTETSPGPAVPPFEELKTFIPEDKLWPIGDAWNFHAGGGKFKNIDLFTHALEMRYGSAKGAADYAWKSQAMTYEGQRAMFEAYGRNKYKSTGIIQWMLNNAWPGLIWHLYSYDLRPAGGYFGIENCARTRARAIFLRRSNRCRREQHAESGKRLENCGKTLRYFRFREVFPRCRRRCRCRRRDQIHGNSRTRWDYGRLFLEFAALFIRWRIAEPQLLLAFHKTR